MIAVLWVALVSAVLLAVAGPPLASEWTRPGPELVTATRNTDFATTEAPTRTQPASTAAEPYVGFYPNPVREHVTFLAREICWCSVHGIRVWIYDVNGKLVWNRRSDMPMIECGLGGEPEVGLPLSNGVYVVRFELLIGDTWRPAGEEKLVVLQ